MSDMQLTKPMLWLFALLAILVGVLFVSQQFARQQSASIAQANGQPVDQNGVRIPPPQPAPTQNDTIAAQNPHGFQLLVSYVNSGFEPRDASIKLGDTVRFTNNSTGQLWIAAGAKDTDPLYPAITNGCGSSALDTCRGLMPGEYWEFTFSAKGTWSFRNNLDTSKTGVVRVQ